MKKSLLTLVTLSVMAFSSFAQTIAKPSPSPSDAVGRFSIGAEGGLPIGDISSAFGSVIGGSIKYEIPTIPRAFLTISAGYTAFLTKSDLKVFGASSSANFIPLKAGAKYYTEGNFFIEGQLGIVFSTEDSSSHEFIFSPGLGYSFNGGFEAGLRYEGWVNGGTISQIDLRLAYRF
jgi:hypothetical protein